MNVKQQEHGDMSSVDSISNAASAFTLNNNTYTKKQIYLRPEEEARKKLLLIGSDEKRDILNSTLDEKKEIILSLLAEVKTNLGRELTKLESKYCRDIFQTCITAWCLERNSNDKQVWSMGCDTNLATETLAINWNIVECLDDFLEVFCIMQKSPPFNNKALARSSFEDYLSKFLVYVLTESVFYYKTRDSIDFSIKWFKMDKSTMYDHLSCYKYFYKNEKGYIRAEKLSTYVKETINFFKVNDTIFEPYGIGCKSLRNKSLNLFTGFKAIPSKNNTTIEPILNHIKKVLCADDYILFNYYVRLEAHKLRYPAIKLPICVIIIGAQGAGKDIYYTEFLIPYVYGKSYATQINGLAKITQQFNSILANKCFIHCSEVESNNKKLNSIIKGLISQKDSTIELKYKECKSCQDYVHYVFTTNEYEQEMVEQGDRRFFILEASNIYLGNHAYFKTLALHFNEETANAYIQYLMALDLSNFNPEAIPKTKLKQLILSNNVSSVVHFIQNYDWGKIVNNSWQPCGILTNGMVDCDQLHTMFLIWADHYQMKRLSLIGMMRDLHKAQREKTLDIEIISVGSAKKSHIKPSNLTNGECKPISLEQIHWLAARR